MYDARRRLSTWNELYPAPARSCTGDDSSGAAPHRLASTVAGAGSVGAADVAVMAVAWPPTPAIAHTANPTSAAKAPRPAHGRSWQCRRQAPGIANMPAAAAKRLRVLCALCVSNNFS